MRKEPIEYPVDSAADFAHVATKAAISSIPVAGGAIAEFFGAFVPSSLSERRDDWGRRLTQAVNTLLERGIVTLEQLRNNQEFVDIVIEATIQATKTSNQMKREALASAVSSSAQQKLDPVKQRIFVRLVDELTESHIRLLQAYSFGRFSSAHGGPEMEDRFFALVGQAFPELHGERDFVLLLCSDLASRTLIATPPKGPRSVGGINYNSMRISKSGTEFLQFIGLAPEPTMQAVHSSSSE